MNQTQYKRGILALKRRRALRYKRMQDVRKMSSREIGAAEGISHERVRQLIKSLETK